MTIDELGYDVVHLGEQVEQLVETSRQEFAGIRHEFSAVHGEMRGILRALETLDLHFSAHASRWGEDSARLHKQLCNLDCRVVFPEKRAA